MDVSTSPNMVPQMQPDPLCGGCPPPGSVPQPNSYWPVQNSGPAFPSWPGQSAQLSQTTQAQAPCWTGQPGATPCWTTQQVPVSAPAQIMMPSPGQAPPMVPAQSVAQTPAVSQAPAVVQDSAMAQSPSPIPPCQTQPCWPPSQYQLTYPSVQTQVPAPAQVPPPVLTPVPMTTPAAGLRPNIWPAHPGWPYNPGQSGWPGQNPHVVPHYWVPTTSGPLSVPYNLNLARGVYDKMMMTILGQVKPNARMFTVNFIKGSDIAFHINPRFSEGGKQVVIRNHKLGERWGTEERELKVPFPFAQGSPFEMKILCTHESFRVAVNNTPLFEFRHRVRELNQIDRVNILHDVVLNYVNVETLP